MYGYTEKLLKLGTHIMQTTVVTYASVNHRYGNVSKILWQFKQIDQIIGAWKMRHRVRFHCLVVRKFLTATCPLHEICNVSSKSDGIQGYFLCLVVFTLKLFLPLFQLIRAHDSYPT